MITNLISSDEMDTAIASCCKDCIKNDVCVYREEVRDALYEIEALQKDKASNITVKISCKYFAKMPDAIIPKFPACNELEKVGL